MYAATLPLLGQFGVVAAGVVHKQPVSVLWEGLGTSRAIKIRSWQQGR